MRLSSYIVFTFIIFGLSFGNLSAETMYSYKGESPVRACMPPTRVLSYGKSGNDVANLQIYLAMDNTIYPEGTISGYYGYLTQAAVARFQKQNGIVLSGAPETTGLGAVGPKTLDFMTRMWKCSGNATVGWFGYVTANDSNSVTFYAQASSSHPLGTQFHINFGDGYSGTTSVSSSVCHSMAGNCSSIVSTSHTYRESGTYTANLSAVNDSGNCINLSQNCGTAGGYCSAVPLCFHSPTSVKVASTTVKLGMPIKQETVIATPQIASTTNTQTNTVISPVSTDATSHSYEESADSILASLRSSSIANSTIATLQSTIASQSTSSPAVSQTSCKYFDVAYAQGITTSIPCTSVVSSGTACNATGSMSLTCINGSWTTPDGTAVSISNQPMTRSASDCITPWGSQIVRNNMQIPYQPFFTNGQYTIASQPPMMMCTNGGWQQCSWIGDACRAYII